MAKTLGSYIRFVPEKDQDTIVGVLSFTRKGLHRGMLCFIPTREILSSLRNAGGNYLNAQQQQASLQQIQQYYPPYPPIGSGQAVGISPTTTGTYATPYTIPNSVGVGRLQSGNSQNYLMPNTNNIYFAYAAVVVAMTLQRRDEEMRENDEEVEQTSGNAEARLEVAQ